jgi:hypothetical protein
MPDKEDWFIFLSGAKPVRFLKPYRFTVAKKYDSISDFKVIST